MRINERISLLLSADNPLRVFDSIQSNGFVGSRSRNIFIKFVNEAFLMMVGVLLLVVPKHLGPVAVWFI